MRYVEIDFGVCDRGVQTDSEHMKKDASQKFSKLVLSGGGVNGIYILGALYNFDISEIEIYTGTSIGAVICYLLLIGYNVSDIIIGLCVNDISFKNADIIGMINGRGIFQIDDIMKHVELMTMEKIGHIPTMSDLTSNYSKKLICTTYNLTEKKTEYISADTHPHLDILSVLKMSCSIPIVFDKFYLDGSIYIDGGIGDNCPIKPAFDHYSRILVIYINYKDRNDSAKSENKYIKLLKYIYEIIMIPVTLRTRECIDTYTKYDNITIIGVTTNSNFENSMFSTLTTTNKLEMFSHGLLQTKK